MGLNTIKDNFLEKMKIKENKKFSLNDDILNNVTEIYKNSLIELLASEKFIEQINNTEYLFIDSSLVKKVQSKILNFIKMKKNLKL
jgi:hypothetical protein